MTNGDRTLYDDVHYPSKAYAYTHPNRLNTIAQLFGMKPAPVDKCRVLELGCGAGGNLIPMAHYCPDSEFLGFDLSADSIDKATATAARLGVPNLTFQQADILEISEDIGPFDYIICHGVYSWVPSDVQKGIFKAIRANLAPNGIAYVSYNTLPGWHLRNVARTIMRFHGEQFDDPMESVEQGKALLGFIGSSLQEETAPWARVVSNAARYVQKFDESYLFHDFFAPVNEPLLFRDFVRRAGDFDLDYVGDAEFGDMVPLTLPPDVKSLLDRIAPDLERTEQYLDLIRGTAFRRSLLCHKGVELNRELSGEDLGSMKILMTGKCNEEYVDLTKEGPIEFASNDEKVITVESPLAQAALLSLIEAFPLSMPFADVVERAHELLSIPVPENAGRTLGGTLLHCYGASLVDLYAWHAPNAGSVPPKPHAHDMVRFEVAEGSDTVTNPRHEVVAADRFTREILRLSDGTRDHTALIDDLVVAVQDERLTVKVDDQVCRDWVMVREAVDAMLKMKLAHLTRAALFREWWPDQPAG